MIAICALGWNHADVTEHWLASVRSNSGGHPIELFLMDNGSSDNTSQVMQSYGPRVFIRNEGNESIYKGWNTLASHAYASGADIICISNNDLIVGPGWLDPVVKNLVAGTKRYFLPNQVPFHGSFEENCRRTAEANQGQTVPARAGWCLLFHRDAIPIFSPIPEELQLWYGDDWIHKKLSEAGYSCEALLDSCVAHFTSTTFHSRPGYVEIVASDREVFLRLGGRL